MANHHSGRGFPQPDPLLEGLDGPFLRAGLGFKIGLRLGSRLELGLVHERELELDAVWQVGMGWRAWLQHSPATCAD